MKKLKIVNYKKFFRFIFFLALFVFFLFKLSSVLQAPEQTASNSVTTDSLLQKEPITIHMAAIGDIMRHSTNFKNAYDSSTKTYDFSPTFKNIKSYIKDADIAIGNLETTFAGSARGYSGYPTFNTPDALGKNLKDLGIDVLSTANNHSMDKGYTGLVSTLDYLDKYKISHTGTYRSKEEHDTILVKDVNGIQIAFLSFTYGTNGITIPSDKKYAVNLIDKDLIKKQIILQLNVFYDSLQHRKSQ